MVKYRLGDIVDIISEREDNPSNCKYDKFVGLEHYISGEVEIKNYGNTDLLKSAMKVFNAGDILIARRNVYLKRASVVNFDGITSGDSIVLRAKDELIKRLLPFVLNTDSFWEYAEKFSDGTMSKRLSPKTLLEYEFSLPDIKEQEKLVELLWAANETKEAYKRLLSLTNDLVKAQFTEMFDRKGYPHIPLKKLCKKITDGTHKTPQYLASGIPFISAKNIKDTKVDFTDVKYISDTEYQEIQQRCQTEKGDILLSKSGTLGAPAVISVDFRFGIFESLAVIKTHPEMVNNVFLCEQIKMPAVQKQFASGTKGIAVKHLHLNVLNEITVVLPPMELQNQFAEFVQQSYKSKLELQQTISNLENTVKSLMKQHIG